MLRLKNAVVVITGASSGIGRATALEFAKAGSKIVVTGRRGELLDAVFDECTRMGAECMPVVCDVTDESTMKALGAQVVNRFGWIDVWVNNAGVMAFGRLDETPYEVCRQVIDTNLLGCLNGCRVALAQFRRQGWGVIINVSSVDGKIGQPFVSVYAASKFGVVGLSDSIRMEVKDYPQIHVCTVLPMGTDTPLFQHAANYAGRQPQPLGPTYTAERVARTIVNLARRPRREITIGAGKVLTAVHAVAPGIVDRVVARAVRKGHFTEQPTAPSPGNVAAPMHDEYAIGGGWKKSVGRTATAAAGAISVGIAVLGALALYGLIRTLAEQQELQVRELEEAAL